MKIQWTFLMVVIALLIVFAAKHWFGGGTSGHGSGAENIAIYMGTIVAISSSRKKRTACTERKSTIQ